MPSIIKDITHGPASQRILGNDTTPAHCSQSENLEDISNYAKNGRVKPPEALLSKLIMLIPE